MRTQSNTITNQIKPARFKICLIAAVALSLAVSVWLSILPGSGGLIGALSIKRLLMLFPPTVSGLFGLFFVFQLYRKPEVLHKKFDALQRGSLWALFFYLSSVFALVSWFILFFVHLLSKEINPFANQRLLPLSVWILCLSLLFLIMHVSPKNERNGRKPAAFTRRFLVFTAFLILCTVLIIFTKSGFYTKDVTVNDLGVPLFEWQILFAFGIIFIITLVQAGMKPEKLRQMTAKRHFSRNTAILLFLCIWLITFLAWNHQSLPDSNYFLPERLPPNFSPYPFSDAERYSLEAMSLLDGKIQDTILEKPMHAVFLAFLYKLGGFDYQRVIFIQTIFLSAFPAILFLIGREIQGYRLGIGMSLFAVFREINQIQAADIANVSNTKLLMSDFPAMLILSLLVLVSILWLKKPGRIVLPILLGGIIGILSLYRAQYLIFFPLLLFLGFFLEKPGWKRYLKFSMILALSLLLTLLPIMIRNWSISGVLWIDSPERFSSLSEHYIMPIQPEDTSPAFGAEKESLSKNGMALGAIVEYGRDIADNFARNLISTVLVFPIRYDGSQSLSELNTISNFWAEPFGYQQPLNFVLLAIILLLVAAGFSRKQKILQQINLGLICFYLVFNFSTALFRFSGWRFIMPVDWFIYVWCSLGYIVCLDPLVSLSFASDLDGRFPEKKRNFHSRPISLFGIIPFILMSSIIPIRTLFPVHYPDNSRAMICQKIEQTINLEELGVSSVDFLSFCHSNTVILNEGILLHPRYFRRAYGFYDRPDDLLFGIQDYSRLTFRILGKNLRKFYLPMAWEAALALPDGSSAVEISLKDQYPESLALIMLDFPDRSVFSEIFSEQLANINK